MSKEPTCRGSFILSLKGSFLPVSSLYMQVYNFGDSCYVLISASSTLCAVIPNISIIIIVPIYLIRILWLSEGNVAEAM